MKEKRNKAKFSVAAFCEYPQDFNLLTALRQKAKVFRLGE